MAFTFPVVGRVPGAPSICFNCKQPFTSANVFTNAGLREIAISGMCEKCFDELFAEEEESPED